MDLARQPQSNIMNEQLKISSTAVAHFKKTIAKKGCFGLLFKVKKAGCSGLKYDMDFINEAPTNADKLDYDGVKLYVDRPSHVYLSETAIDLEEASLGQTKIVFFNPKAQNACGCGESFNVKGDTNE